MRRTRLVAATVVAAVSMATVYLATIAPAATPNPLVANKVLNRQLEIELGKATRPAWLQRVSSGPMYAVLQATGVIAARVRSAAAKAGAPSFLSTTNTNGCSYVFTGGNFGNNTRVNQDCSLRRQAEETIAVNPTNTKNLIAGQNDSRIGFNHCGYDWSFDGGVHWGDQLPPFFQTVLLDGHTADACSDPTAAFDSQGNAYAGGVLFDITSVANAVVVARSDAAIGGAFYHSTDPSLGAFKEYFDSPIGIVANDNDGCIFNDKELLTADSHSSSPKADNVYMVWTRFNECTGQGVGANSPIYFSQSTDGGNTWSPGIEISGSNKTYCTAFSGESNPNACDQDQGGDPYVAPDGSVWVVFSNGNTPTAGINQKMALVCHAGSDCSTKGGWNGPYKVADSFDIQPVASITDPVTGCPEGRQCLPPNGYRMDDFVEVSISVDNNGFAYVVWSDGRNLAANCQGDYASATPPCDQDVFFSYSTDGGVTWKGPYDVSSHDNENSAQWMPWSGVGPGGLQLWIAYYDRSYGDCETTGCNDITLAKVDHPRSARTITYTRETTKSMPNLVIANNPAEAGFLGDYMWVAVDNRSRAYVVWADTRGRNDGRVEEDIYFHN